MEKNIAVIKGDGISIEIIKDKIKWYCEGHTTLK